jgi:hypothetical protein
MLIWFRQWSPSNADVTSVDPPPPSFTCKNALSPTTTIHFFFYTLHIPNLSCSSEQQSKWPKQSSALGTSRVSENQATQ